MIHFIRPAWLLALIPVVFFTYRLYQLVRVGGDWRRACDAHLLPYIFQAAKPARQYAKLLVVMAWVLIVMGLAGPSWYQAAQTVFKNLTSRVIVLDLSSSMNAADIKPSRLSRAKFKVLDLLKENVGGRMGMIVFAGEPYVISPLTQDANTIAGMVSVLETSLMPAPGQNMAFALNKAEDLLSRGGVQEGEIILITDSNPDKLAMESATQANNAGYRVEVLAMGTEKGAPIPDRSGFVSDAEGNIIVAKLPLEALRRLAQAGGGQLIRFTNNDRDIKTLVKLFNIDDQGESTEETVTQWVDEGHWFALLALLFLLPLFQRGRVSL